MQTPIRSDQLNIGTNSGEVVVADYVNGYVGTGTSDAITVTPVPSIPDSTDCIITIKVPGSNTTTTPTLQPSGWAAAKTIVKGSGVALAAGDLVGWHTFRYDTALGQFVVLNSGTTKLQYFNEARNATFPNTTVPAHQWVADGAEANIDLVLSPKGTGSILSNIPDNGTAGGNKRGTYAVDLQTTRSAATQVASGNYSVIIAGDTNTANGTYGVVVGGYTNTSSGYASFIGGGYNNVSSGTGSFVGGGAYNTADGNESVIPGGTRATTRGMFGKYSFANSRFVIDGDNQIGTSVLSGAITIIGPSVLTSTGALPNTTNINILPDNHTFAVTATVVARIVGTGESAVWKVEGVVKRGTGVASTALVGTPAITTLAMDAALSATYPDLVAENTTYGAAEIQVTSLSGTAVHWTCKFDTIEVG